MMAVADKGTVSMDVITNEVWTQPFYVYGMIVSDSSRRRVYQLPLLTAIDARLLLHL